MEKIWNPRNIFSSLNKTLLTQTGPIVLCLSGTGRWFVRKPDDYAHLEDFADVWSVCAWLNDFQAQETQQS